MNMVTSGTSRCIFCKQQSADSVSVEHIVPESLGNTRALLPPGIVCDDCNNYFARKVEGPLLQTAYFKNLRGRQRIASKRGRVPAQEAILLDPLGLDDVPGIIHSSPLTKRDRPSILSFEDWTGAAKILGKSGAGHVLVGSASAPPESDVTLSRFLAKVALEFLVDRIRSRVDWQAYIVDNPEFDPIREHARRGRPRSWPYSCRRIYEENRPPTNQQGIQCVWEWDTCCRRISAATAEVYSVLALFGIEYAINIAGPSIEGYHDHLRTSGGRSPLYAKEAP